MSMATKDGNGVRLSHSLSKGEIKATQKRREKVLMCLKDLEIHCNPNNVPNIAVLGSGGGLRAMIALLGTLVGLKKKNILDAVMYLCGVSGSTWLTLYAMKSNDIQEHEPFYLKAHLRHVNDMPGLFVALKCMSLLYEDEKWSENLMSLKEKLCQNLSNSSQHTRKAEEYLEESSKDEHYSLTDFWASFVACKVLKQFDENELADHKEASETGINPYPIYAAVNKEKLTENSGQSPGTWFEFTPHEAGYTALGAFVSTKHFGSEFENGELKKEKKKHICYMQGLWGSALGSMEENLKFIKEIIISFLQRYGLSELMSSNRLESNSHAFMACCYQPALLLLDLQICAVSGSDPKEVFEKLLNVLSEDKETSASYQLCKAMCDTWAMKTKEERMESCAELGNEIEREFAVCLGEEGTLEGVLQLPHGNLLGSVLDIFKMASKTVSCACRWKWGTTNNFLYKCPNVPCSDLVKTKTISLIDAGLAINSAYPLVLRAQRRTDLIISFDFSSGDPFETIQKTAKYCDENHIPFPSIEVREEDKSNPCDCYIFRGDKSCPTVMHFPLFNNVNCSGEIEKYRSNFSTFNMSYSKENIEDLLAKASLNVYNNSGKILQEIERLVASSHAKEF